MRKTALVTGASRGIGFAVAKRLEAQGCSVVLCARALSGEAERFACSHRETALFVPADIGRAADRERLLSETVRRFGRLDVLVNNAGVAPKVRRDMLLITEEDYDYVMDINLKGTYFLTQAAARLMAGNGGGCIVNAGSVSSAAVSVNRAEYCLSKAGVHMLTKLFAVRLAELHIAVFELAAGVIDTDMISCVREKYESLAGSGVIPAKRLGSPEDMARLCAAVVSGDLDYATGSTIYCAGGLQIPVL